MEQATLSRPYRGRLGCILLLLALVATSLLSATAKASVIGDRVVSIANAEVGVLEGSARANSYGPAGGQSGSTSNYSWCAVFVSWVMQQSGGTSYRNAAVGEWVRVAKAGTFGLSVTTTPSPGDLVAFDWDNNNDFAWPQRHIGIVKTVPGSNGSFTTIEGNTSGPNGDGVYVKTRSKTSNYNVLFIHISGNTSTPTPSPINGNPAGPMGDFTGDESTDLGIIRTASGKYRWIVRNDVGGTLYDTEFGVTTDIPVRGDYDGNGRTDIAVFRPSTHQWLQWQGTGQPTKVLGLWGDPGDKPIYGDFTGDGIYDLGVIRTSGSDLRWIIRSESGSTLYDTLFGKTSDYPVVGDFDGNGRADIAVFRPSTHEWIQWQGVGQPQRVLALWGDLGDKPVVADFTGDGRTDIAVVRTSTTHRWIVRNDQGGILYDTVFGNSTDVPVVGDFDKNGRTDISVWRSSTHQWIQWQGVSQPQKVLGLWGDPGDRAIPSNNFPF